MKRLFLMAGILAVLGLSSQVVFAEEPMNEDTTTAMVEEGAAMAEEAVADEPETTPAPAEEEAPVMVERSFHQVVKQKFIEGDPGFMAFVVVSLILGLAICIERIIYLAMATTNTKKLLGKVEDALNSGGVESAKEVCKSTSGPVASIFLAGLNKQAEGNEAIEKAVVGTGSVQMALLEKGVSWISLFIALAPMLGFMGTVIGMIQSFESIARENNLSIGIVADGIGVALITTVSGLIVAMILQVFYNYIISKIDNLVMDMEEASMDFVDLVATK